MSVLTFRWKMIQVAGRIEKHSGSIILKIAAGLEKLELFLGIRHRSWRDFTGELDDNKGGILKNSFNLPCRMYWSFSKSGFGKEIAVDIAQPSKSFFGSYPIPHL